MFQERKNKKRRKTMILHKKVIITIYCNVFYTLNVLCTYLSKFDFELLNLFYNILKEVCSTCRQLMKLKMSGANTMQRSLLIQVKRDCVLQFLKTFRTSMLNLVCIRDLCT